jgi:CMP-N-acetylneuraminic acid synthetase
MSANRQRVLAIIPARGGSTGFKDKNIARIEGRSLIQIAIETAQSSQRIDAVHISTDSQQYQEMALACGAQSAGLRPGHLASDSARTIDVVLDLLDKLDDEYEVIVLLQPTSPLRTGQDIDKAIDLLQEKSADAVVSVVKHDEPHPYKLKKLDSERHILPFIEGSNSEIPRQELPTPYALNGAIYVIRTDTIRKDKTFFPSRTVAYEMDRCVNIDSEEDFEYLQYLVRTKKVELN